MENDQALMKPVSKVERSEEFNSKQKVTGEVEEQQKKGVIDRAEDIAGELADKLKM
jgi:hypothetical protein